MKILKERDYIFRVVPSTLGTVLYHCQNDDYFFNEEYQRPYVWGDKERMEFMDSLFDGKPIGVITIIVLDESKPTEWLEVVDGRQRLTTLKMFFNNEFSYKGYYWNDLCEIEKRRIKSINFSVSNLEMVNGDNVPDKIKIEAFHSVNFSGVPQSEEHKKFIESVLEKYNETP